MARDRFTGEVIKDAIVAIGQEMFEAMLRTSMSPIIYETADFAVGITDARGNLLAQGNGVVAFLATLDTAVQSTLEKFPLEAVDPGDVFIANTPYAGGGTHLSDVTILVPIFVAERLIAWAANKAHWTEIGGAAAGSVSTTATEIFQEGLHFPFVKLYERGRVNQALLDVIRVNVRLPDSTLGDLHAGVAAANVGRNRVVELARRYGCDAVLQAMEELLDYGEKMARLELAKLPRGRFEAQDVIEDDGLGNGPFCIRVAVEIDDDRVVFDFSGSDPQAPGPANTTYTGLVTGSRCIFKAITNPHTPANGGSFRPLRVICPPGTILSAESPAPVSIYFDALVAAMDLVCKALAPSMPDILPAGTQRSVGATFLSGIHPDSGAFFVMGEPLVGGWGALRGRDGDGGQFCLANGETYNIPIELFESRYGVRIEQYAFHDHDGGHGAFRGGRGVVLDYRVTSETAYLTYAATRTESKPWGVAGGGEGTNNYVEVHRLDGRVERRGTCTALAVRRGELIRLYSATGGGFGPPTERDPEAVASDLRNGFLTPAQARAIYGHRGA